MNGITKSKSTKLLSALLAVLMIVAMLPTTAFAWSVEEGTKCTSTYGDHYVGSDGEMFYSKPTTTAIFYNDDGSFYVKTYSSGNAKYKYMMIDGNGNQHHVYCIEGGVSFDYSDTYNSTSGKNSKYPVSESSSLRKILALRRPCSRSSRRSTWTIRISLTISRTPTPTTNLKCQAPVQSGRRSFPSTL